MRICNKCRIEYPDEMAFCSRCGTPLQSKAQKNVCPACGKVLGKDKLQFCPYCGHKFDSSETKNQTANKPVVTGKKSKNTKAGNIFLGIFAALWIGSLIFCILTGAFDIIFVIIFVIAVFLIYLKFFSN